MYNISETIKNANADILKILPILKKTEKFFEKHLQSHVY